MFFFFFFFFFAIAYMVSIQNTLFRLAFIVIYEIKVFSQRPPKNTHWATQLKYYDWYVTPKYANAHLGPPRLK